MLYKLVFLCADGLVAMTSPFQAVKSLNCVKERRLSGFETDKMTKDFISISGESPGRRIP